MTTHPQQPALSPPKLALPKSVIALSLVLLGAAPLVATPGWLLLNGGGLLATDSFTLAANRGVALQGTGSIEVASGKTLKILGAVADAAATGNLAKYNTHDGISALVAAGMPRNKILLGVDRKSVV